MTGLAQFINDDDDEQRAYEAELMRRGADSAREGEESGPEEVYRRRMVQEAADGDATDERIAARSRASSPMQRALQWFFNRESAILREVLDQAMIPGQMIDPMVATPLHVRWSRRHDDHIDAQMGMVECQPNAITTRSQAALQRAMANHGVEISQTPPGPREALLGFRIVECGHMPPNTAALHTGRDIRLITWDDPSEDA